MIHGKGHQVGCDAVDYGELRYPEQCNCVVSVLILGHQEECVGAGILPDGEDFYDEEKCNCVLSMLKDGDQ